MRAHPIFRLALLLIIVRLARAQNYSPDQAPFSASPQALQAAFATVAAEEHAVTVLLEEGRFEFDGDGLLLYRHRMIFKVWTKAGADDWAMIEKRWAPWQEERPVVRARVISPDGTALDLDPKTIADSPVRDGDEDVLTDRQMVRAALPGIAAGTIIQQEIVTRQTALSLRAGTVRHFSFGASAPVLHTRVRIVGPKPLAIRFKVQMLPDAVVVDQTKGDLREIVIDQGPLKELEDAPPLLAPDEVRYPRVVISTAREWKDVAEEYAAVVDRQLKGFNASKYLPKMASGATREAKILAVVQKMNQEIRYTGIEFSESSVVPHKPSEVLEHKYGDCKDKSTLMVALLRAAGIEAYVALLNSSSGKDIEPDLPGMDVFNHAIVYAPGSPDFWLDPTDPDLRMGVVSPDNQGRYAMVARPGSTALVTTPRLTADENRVAETREFWLPELGRARVTETSETLGTVDSDYRGELGDQDQKALQESLKKYIDWTYGEAKVVKISTSESADLVRPFRLTIELDDAQRGSSERTEAAVAIFLSGIGDRLPKYFREEPKSETDAGAVAPPKRAQDYYLPEPFTQELHYILHAPPGFRIRQLPEDKEEQLGIATLNARFSRENDTTARADFRFVIARQRFSATEGSALREAVTEVRKRKAVMIYFDQIGETALASGKVREALAEFNALSKVHPREALHAMQTARALLAAGAGEAARSEARRAVATEPGSAKAYVQLAEVLKHDLVGRPLEKGFDPEGAATAYRKALELDSSDNRTRADLAIVLEYNSAAVRYGAGSRLEEALAEYKKIADKLTGLGLPQNYAAALLHAGHFAELKEHLEKQPDNDANQTLRVCAEAMLSGSKTAVRKAGDVSGGVAAKQRALSSAAQTLMTMRQYALAADLFEETAIAAPNPAALTNLVRVLQMTKRAEESPITMKQPEDAVRLFIDRALRYEEHQKDWTETVSGFAKAGAGLERLNQFRQGVATARGSFRKSGMGLELGYDLTQSALQCSRDGSDEAGWVIRVAIPGSEAVGQNQTYYVVKEDGVYRLLAAPGILEGLARLVLQLAEDGKLDAARAWLNRVRTELPAGGGDDPLSGPLYSRLWQTGQKSDGAAIRLAAAGLLVTEEDSEIAVAILKEGLNSADAVLAPALSSLLANAYFSTRHYRESLELAESLLKNLPQSASAFQATLRGAYALGGKKEADRVVDTYLDRFRDDVSALNEAATIAMVFGDTQRSTEIEKRIVDSGRASSANYNQLAWADLMSETATAVTLEFANKGLVMASNQSTGLMHTLAAVYAELGKESEARATILQRMNLMGSVEPDDEDWYVFGRIAEQYGLKEEAATMYRRVSRPKTNLPTASTTYALAQRRLKATGVAAH